MNLIYLFSLTVLGFSRGMPPLMVGANGQSMGDVAV